MSLMRAVRCLLLAAAFGALCEFTAVTGAIATLVIGIAVLACMPRTDSSGESLLSEYLAWLICVLGFAATTIALAPIVGLLGVPVALALCLCSSLLGTMVFIVERGLSRWRRFQWSLRTLFVVVAVFGMLLGWVVYQLNWIRARRDVMAREGLKASTATYLGPNDWNSPPWPLGLFGAEAAGFPELILPSNTPDEELSRIQKLFPETSVRK